MTTHFWLGTGTLIKSGRVKLVLWYVNCPPRLTTSFIKDKICQIVIRGVTIRTNDFNILIQELIAQTFENKLIVNGVQYCL
jgi:hypothetical protein